jgi:hypothetical protein
MLLIYEALLAGAVFVCIYMDMALVAFGMNDAAIWMCCHSVLGVTLVFKRRCSLADHLRGMIRSFILYRTTHTLLVRPSMSLALRTTYK